MKRHGPSVGFPGLYAAPGIIKRVVPALVPWVPQDLGASLLIWNDASDLSNGAVSSWAAKVGTCTLTQGTAGNQPTKAATSFNSAHPGVTFTTSSHNDANGDWLITTSQGSIPVGTTPCMLWVVCSGQAETDARHLINIGGSTGQRRIVQNANESISIHDNTSSCDNNTASSMLGNHILCGEFSAASLSAWLDGVAFAENPQAATLNTGTFVRMRLAAGSSTGAANIANTIVAHMFITDVLSQADRERMEGWIAHDVGLTGNLASGHPYKTQAPMI